MEKGSKSQFLFVLFFGSVYIRVKEVVSTIQQSSKSIPDKQSGWNSYMGQQSICRHPACVYGRAGPPKGQDKPDSNPVFPFFLYPNLHTLPP
jgi:hypothetical protein